MGIRILKGGMMTTVQDLGRYGYQSQGFSVAGVMDVRSFKIANLLLDNPENEAVLEITLIGPTLEFTSATIIAITGGDFQPTINGEPAPMYTALYMNKGDVLKFGSARTGSRGYIAFSSYLDIPVVMGSRCTNLKSGLGGFKGRKLEADDYIGFRIKRRYLPFFLSRKLDMDEFDQIGVNQQSFLKHILQKPVVNTRRPNASAVESLRRYASFIGTSNHKDLLTDTSGSRRFIGVEVTGVIDTNRPIDYEQLYAQAMHEISHGERYWFNSEDEQIMTENNREFEQTPAMIQLFYQYFRAPQAGEEGEFFTPVEILNYLKKKSGISLSDNKVYHFGRMLQKCGIASKHTYKGTVYQVVKIL